MNNGNDKSLQNFIGQQNALAEMLVFTILLLLIITVSSNAAVYTVTTTTDDGDGICDAVCTFRDAVVQSNATGEDDEIVFAVTGTISLDHSAAGFLLRIDDAASAGTLKIIGTGADDLTIRQVGIFAVISTGIGSISEINALTISDGRESSATADGAGINNYGDLTLNKVVLTGNRATAGAGGMTNNGGIVVINDSSIINNESGSTGGILNIGGDLTVNNSTIANNSGIGIISRNFVRIATVTLNNSTISGNHRSSFSFVTGGIANGEEAGLFINNTTISNNEAISGSGGGIQNRGRVTLTNSIVANSIGGEDCVNILGKISAYNTLIESGLECVDDISVNNLIGDPLLGPLADNGGITLTHALLSGSPVIDVGDNSLIPPGFSLDQRKELRIINEIVDLGSVESIQDEDLDGVPDVADVCEGTTLPEANPTQGLKQNRFIADAAGNFVDINWEFSGITITDTGGCSGIQIINAAGLGEGHRKFGITRSALLDWIANLPQ